MCPMPLLKAKKALNGMTASQTLRVLATDPGSERDFQVFAEQSGHTLLQSSAANGVYSYWIRKKTMNFIEVLGSWVNRYFSRPDAIFLVAAILAVSIVLYVLAGALAPVLTGLVIAFLLQGLVDRLQSLGCPRLPAILIAMVVLLGSVLPSCCWLCRWFGSKRPACWRWRLQQSACCVMGCLGWPRAFPSLLRKNRSLAWSTKARRNSGTLAPFCWRVLFLRFSRCLVC